MRQLYYKKRCLVKLEQTLLQGRATLHEGAGSLIQSADIAITKWAGIQN